MLSLKRLTGVSGWEDRTLAQEETHFAGAVSVPQRPFLARLQTAHLPLVGCTRGKPLVTYCSTITTRSGRALHTSIARRCRRCSFQTDRQA